MLTSIFSVIVIGMIHLSQSINTISSLIKIDYLSANCIKIPLHLGKERREVEMLYDTATSQTAIKEDRKPSQSVRVTLNLDMTFNLLNYDYFDGDEVIDSLNPPSLESLLQSFHYINYSRSSYPNVNYDGIIGLGRNYSMNESSPYSIRFSYLHFLYNNKLIDNTIFSHYYYPNKTHAEVIFGSIPHIYQGKPSPQCKPISSKNESQINHSWNCALQSFRFENGKTISGASKPVIFSTGRDRITMPFKEGLEIFMELELLSNHSCYIEPGHSKTYTLLCRSFQLNTFPYIYFNFGEFEIKMETNYMFIPTIDARMSSLFKSVFFIHPLFDYWVFGNSILRNIDMAFDYEKDEVQVFNALMPNNNDANKEEKRSNGETIRLIIMITAGIASIGIITALFIKTKTFSNYMKS